MKTLLIATMASLTLLSGTALADNNDGKPGNDGVTGGRLLGELIYRAGGARENGTIATSVSCSNFTGAAQSVQIVMRSWDFPTTATIYNETLSIPANNNRTFSTHNTSWLSEDISGVANTPPLNQGTVMIRSTSRDVHCSAWISDGTATTPAGATPLHLVRFNAAAGSTE